jgi:Flp pilus assembly protein TadD
MSYLRQLTARARLGATVRRAPIAALAFAVACGGCAARESRFASRFVRPGEPSVSFDEPGVKPPQLRKKLQDVRKLLAPPTPKSSLLPSLETKDSALAKALLLLAMQETPAHHRAVAAAYRDAGVLDYAFRHLQRAAALDRCDAAALDGMARLWRGWGRPDVAMGEAYRALHCNPTSPEIYNTLGTIMQALGQTVNARAAYERAVALDSHAAYALNNLCYLELSEGQSRAAEDYCRMALAESPAFEPARNNLALAYVVGNDAAGAERQLMIGGPSGDSWYNVGMLRLATGRYLKAAEAFDEASMADESLTMASRRAVQARRAALHPEQADEHR